MLIIRNPYGEKFYEQELYTFLSRLWSRCQVVFGHREDVTYDFQTEDLQVNVMGIRGLFYALSNGRPTHQNSVMINKSGVFDDCILILRREGAQRRVHSFSASLEYGKPSGNGNEAALRDLRLGMHRYHFGFHHQSRPRVRLDKAPLFPKGKAYRALRPFNAGAYYDDNRDRSQTPEERLCATEQHNIHAGNASDSDTGFTGSEGCQVIKAWDQFKDFMELLEADYSLRGTESNELNTPRPANQEATRDITYTLIDANCLFPCQLPVGSPEKRALSFTHDRNALANTLELMDAVARSRHGGNYPIGQNHCWHGGLHLPTLLNQDILAPMPGEIVAFRLGNNGRGRACARWHQDGEELNLDLGNRNFILMRHSLTDAMGCLLLGQPYSDAQGHPLGGHGKVFYSLYMHLAEHPNLSPMAFEGKQVPFKWLQATFEVRTATGGSRAISFPAYRILQGGDEAARSRQGMVVKQHPVTLASGDRFRLLKDNLLVQNNELWVQIERYYDGTRRRSIDPPEPLYLLKKHLSDTFAKPLAEWKRPNTLEALSRGDILFAEDIFGHTVPVSTGELLWRTGEGLQPGGNTGAFLHWSVFSTEPVFPEWNRIVDDTQDSVIEDRSVLDRVPQAPERRGQPLTEEEVRGFYRSEDPEIQRRIWELAWTTVKFQSEWVGDSSQHAARLAALPQGEERQLNQQAYQESADPFLWWREVASRLGLPTDGKVWHYHPAVFTLALGIFTESARVASLAGTAVLRSDALPDLETLLPTSPTATAS